MSTQKKATYTETADTTATANRSPVKISPCPTAEEVEIKFAWGVNRAAVSEFSLEILKEILSKACIKTATISSTARSNEGQAKAMYKNLTTGNLEKSLKREKKLYGRGGGWRKSYSSF